MSYYLLLIFNLLTFIVAGVRYCICSCLLRAKEVQKTKDKTIEVIKYVYKY